MARGVLFPQIHRGWLVTEGRSSGVLDGQSATELGDSKIRVLHVTAYRGGGAGRAARRIALATSSSDSEIDNSFFYSQPERGFQGLLTYVSKQLIRIVSRGVFRPGVPELHSVAKVPTRLGHWINMRDFDLVHLHWLGDTAISIEEIASIKAPLIWTLHDMWPFCGAEHYSHSARHRDGYTFLNRPDYERGPDINRWVWKRKKRHWTMPVHAVSPSEWLAEEARRSTIGKSWDVQTIPNPVDVDFWSPGNRDSERSEFGLDEDTVFLVFVAEKGLGSVRKGGPQIVTIATELAELLPNRRVVVGVAGLRHPVTSNSRVEIRQFGPVSSDAHLRSLYRAADFTLAPSHQDNFPTTVAESLACGTPVATYDASGMKEMVEDGVTGVLAQLGNTAELARRIAAVLEDASIPIERMREAARNQSVQLWTPRKVGAAYAKLYREVLLHQRT